ncbi:MAG: ATP-binding cassette domain-containing protein [Phycisphaerae bacterium]|nr:ATP-binding cassette domain-containing protein [Phycisphaerae bacterium]
MAIISLQNTTVGYGGNPILTGIDLNIEKGQKISLIGRNGSGKSTLLKLIAGELEADSGRFIVQQGLTIARLIQQVPQDIDGMVYQIVAAGLGPAGELLGQDYYLHHNADLNSQENLDKLADIHHKIDDHHAWQYQTIIDETIDLIGLDPVADFGTLSSGMKRRVLLARCLVTKPDVLILDEPTNHLDVGSIVWMEQFLLGYQATLLLVSHDRTFVRKVSNGIIDIDRGRVTRYDCSYEKYLQRKEADIKEEQRQNELFNKKLAEEEVWIRKGIQARRTRNEGRVRQLEAMRLQRQDQRQEIGNVKLEAQQTQASGRKVIEIRKLAFGFDDQPIVKNFSTDIMRGDRIGIIGPNGSGKTTLIKLMLGQLTPDSGTVKHGTNLELAYFDQLHATLDDEKSLQDNIAPNSDKVEINGQPRHIIGYLSDFLFSPDQIRKPVSKLSGGERNRLLLARMFTRPANVLVLDEPTNDLDVETLELLEDLLLDFPGTILMVSHDRSFLNNVVTSTIAIEGDGLVKEYGGGYDDYLLQSTATARENEKVEKTLKKDKPKDIRRDGQPKVRKLSFKENQELAQLPEIIEKLESQLEQIHTDMAQPDFYKKPPTEITRLNERTSRVEAELADAYARWEELEEISQQTK